MILAGYSGFQLLLLFGVAGSAVTALYLLRMRRRRVVVPFAALWEQVTRPSETQQLWRRLRRVMSWLAQLFILLFVVLALGDPRPTVWIREPTTLALVVDHSASMAGTTRNGVSRLELAKQWAKAEVAALGPTDDALVIAVDERVDVVAPRVRDHERLAAAIDTIVPSYGTADFESALALARQAVAAGPGPRIVVLTDGALTAAAHTEVSSCHEATTCEVVLFESPTHNVGITAFSARRYPHDVNRIEVIADVRNFGDIAATVILEIETDAISLGRRRVELRPGQNRVEVLQDLDASRARLTARIRPSDQPDGDTPALWGPRFDDVAFAVVPPLQPMNVHLLTDGTNLFLEAALLALDDRVRLSTNAEPGLEEADLLFVDLGTTPPPSDLPATNIVMFDPWRHPASPSPIAKSRDVVRPFLTEQDVQHPILDSIVLKDINIARGTTFRVEPRDVVVARHLGQPIIVLRESAHIFVAVGFDTRQSDFPLRSAFPLLVDNLIGYVEQRDSNVIASLTIGQSHRVGLANLGLSGSGISRIRIDDPNGNASELPVDRGRFHLHSFIPGFYRVTALDGDTPGLRADLAVNPSTIEASDLHRTLGIEPPTDHRAPSPVPLSGPLWTTLVLLVAGALAIEWATYHRRVTV